MEHNIVQHLHSAALDNATVDSATSIGETLNSTPLIVKSEKVQH